MPRQFLRHVTRSLSADAAGIWLLDETGEWLEPSWAIASPRTARRLPRLRLRVADHPLYAEAARTLRPMVSTDVSEDPRLAGAAADLVPHHSQLFVPIVANDRMMGGFAVLWAERGRPFPRASCG